MKKLVAITTLACLAVLASCSRNPIYADRSSEPQTQFDFNGHCATMCRSSLQKYAFENYGPKRFKAWQKKFRAELKDALGVSIIEQQLKGYKPTLEQIDSEDLGFAVRERWQIWTEPDVNIPFIMIRPKTVEGKVPLVITPHGHGKNTEQYAGVYVSPEDSISAVDGQRNMAYLFAQQGFITITPAARGFAGTMIDEDSEDVSCCALLMCRDALVGRTPVGDRVWDIMKILDWALAELPVDENKVIVTGNSGGGTQSVYAGAIDTRISICMPASSFSSYEASIGVQEHCACNYVPGVMNLGDMGDVLGLVAPRPLCLIQGKDDPIFPVEGAKEQFETIRKVYEAAGVPDTCELYIGPEGHRYYFDGADAFVQKHL